VIGGEGENVNIFVFARLAGYPEIEAQGGPNARSFIGNNVSTNAAATKEKAQTTRLKNGSGNRDGKIGIIVIFLVGIGAQIFKGKVLGLKPRLNFFFEAKTAMIRS